MPDRINNAEGGRGPAGTLKVTKAREVLILKLLRAGNSRATTADAAGIDEESWAHWMSAKSLRYRGFQNLVQKAEAEAEASLVAKVSRAANGGAWRAAAWLLERINPEDWAEPRKKADKDADDDAAPNPLAQFDEVAQARARVASRSA